MPAMLLGAGISALIGFNKELADYSSGKQFSVSEMFSTTIGGVLSSAIIYHVRSHYRKKFYKQKRVFFW